MRSIRKTQGKQSSLQNVKFWKAGLIFINSILLFIKINNYLVANTSIAHTLWQAFLGASYAFIQISKVGTIIIPIITDEEEETEA